MVPETNSSSRVQVKWPVTMNSGDGSADGVILNINRNGAFIRCQRPLRLSATCKLRIESPDHPIEDVTAEVVWSNIYGPDDDLTPRGMGVRFTGIPEKEQKFLGSLEPKNNKARKISGIDLDEIPELVH